MTQWPEVRIGDLGEVFTGRTPSTERPSYFGSDYPFVTPGDMHQGKFVRETERSLSQEGADLLKRIQLPANSVCVSCIGWQMGEVVMISSPSFTNQQINSIVSNGKIEPSFLYYSLRPRKQELLSLGAATGVRTPILNKSTFCNLKVRLPPLPTQRRIASILSAYDDLIENNNKRIRILEDMARNLYREWFVHFRFPGHEKVKMIDSPLGKIPKGWNTGSIADLATVHRGCSYRKEDLVEDGGRPFINLKNIARDGGFRRDGTKRYNGPFKPTHVVGTGSIVMAVTDMTQERRIVARVARVPDIGGNESVISMDLVCLEPNDNISADYLYCFFRYSEFSDEVKNHANGANVLHLSPDRIREYRAVFPDVNLQDEFGQFVSSINAETDILAKKNDVLRQTRDLLLPKLISGEIDMDGLDTKGVV